MSDDLIWQVINHQFCSFKLKTTKGQNFCRNEFNVSGLCNRQSCPLANAKYATVRSIDGKLYLYMKTAERAHTPAKLWERVKLSRNYATALQQIDEQLPYWSSFLIHKCKQRMTRYFQVAIRERREAKKINERQLVGVQAPKVRRREQVRERKALVAGKIEKNIEKELLQRLKSGAYGENPLNVDEDVWNKVLKNMQKNDELEQDELDEDEEDIELEEEDDEDVGQVEYVEEDENDDDEIVELEDLEKWLGGSDASESSGSESEADSDDEDSNSDSDSDTEDKKAKKDTKPSKKRRRKGPRVEIEYEQEPANTNERQVAW